MKVGEESKIQRWIRPRRRLPPSRRRNLIAQMKRDASNTYGGHDAPSTIERAMQALIGAVYYDGGIEAVRKVMFELRLLVISKKKTNTEEPVAKKHVYQ